jgi:hypothetical protein
MKKDYLGSELVDGYVMGYESSAMTIPECHKNKSAVFKHGWLNGRDDRIGKPRASADSLRRRLGMIENSVGP